MHSKNLVISALEVFHKYKYSKTVHIQFVVKTSRKKQYANQSDFYLARKSSKKDCIAK